VLWHRAVPHNHSSSHFSSSHTAVSAAVVVLVAA
jgi:hypothetical protein